MKKILNTVINGYMGILFPLIMTVILLEKLHHMISPLVQRIEDKVQITRTLGVVGIIVISAVIMILLGLICGLIVKSPYVKKQIEKFEDKVLSKIPIYTLLKSIFNSELGIKGKEHFRPALLQDGDSFSLCYVTSESQDYYTIFMTDGGLGGGELRIVPKNAVRILKVGLNEFTRIIKQYGVNSAQYAEAFLHA